MLSLPALIALGQTGPGLRAAGLPWDLRKTQPYCGYEEYEFDVPVADKSDAFNRTWVRVQECHQSLRIIFYPTKAKEVKDREEKEAVTHLGDDLLQDDAEKAPDMQK